MKERMDKELKQKRVRKKKEQLDFVWLHVLPKDLWLKVRRGETVWEALQPTDVEIGGDCGGLGKCGKCKVKILSPVGIPPIRERDLLTEDELDQGIRLACRTGLKRDLVVSTEEADSDQDYVQILTTSHTHGGRHLPVHYFEPLVEKRLVTVSGGIQVDGLADLERLRLAMGPAYQKLKSTLNCLQTLPEALRETGYDGVAVLHEDFLLAWQDRAEMFHQYGIVFDLGTSTLVGKLINLVDGVEVAVASCLNSQSRYGTNVISRLQYVRNHPRGVENLHRILIKNLNQLCAHLLETAGVKAEDVFVAVAAGNTAMQHLLLKLNASWIAEAPFTPVVTDGMAVRASETGLMLHPDAVLHVMPAKSGYIGGDLLGVILASGASEQEEEIVLGLDLGTNGEIFLGNGSRMMTCSVAAGPALEGARISDGMIAKAGAIQSVSFEGGDLHYLVVGNIKPKGLCGSGLVELVAVLLELGIIDHEGLIRRPRNKVARKLRSRVVRRGGVNDFLVCSADESFHGKPIYLRQRDVRELQLAKAAVAAGIRTLIEEMGVEIDDISQVYLAGALGNYVNRHSAMRIGLLPRFDPDKLVLLGNAAGTGASMVILSREYWQMAKALAVSIEHVELSWRTDFDDHFVANMDFPKDNALHLHNNEALNHIVSEVSVGEVMTTHYPTIRTTATVLEMNNLLRDTGRHGFPVLDENGRLFGVATIADLSRALEKGGNDLRVGEIATQELFVAFPDQLLDEVLGATREDYGRIPVVERDDMRCLVGVLRRQDIMKAYRLALKKATARENGCNEIPESDNDNWSEALNGARQGNGN